MIMGKNDKIYHTDSLDKLSEFDFERVVAAIGVFDGIHLGHRKLIKKLIDMSRATSAAPVIITFYPHPRVVLEHEKELRFLRNPDKKKKILERLGVKAIVTIPFNKEFAALPPEQFIKHFLLPEKVKLCGICVGSEWRFGQKATGSICDLQNFAQEYNFCFSAVNELHRNNILISSTAIRKALRKGNFKIANFMLDCIYSINADITSIDTPVYGYTKLKLWVKFGILPPVGEYSILIRNRDGKIPAKAKVLDEENIEVFYPAYKDNITSVEFEFVKKLNL